jgi:hypothetical protein
MAVINEQRFRLKLAATLLFIVCSVWWVVSQLARDPFVRWATVGDWILEVVLLWLLVCLLTSLRWIRQRTPVYLSMLAAGFYVFVDHFLVHNMYAGATYRMAAAALAVGTALVGLANVWFLGKVVRAAKETQIRRGVALLWILAGLTAAFGNKVLPWMDRWHPSGN